MTEIHSCSYYCTRPACVLAQRDELRDLLDLIDRRKPSELQRYGGHSQQAEPVVEPLTLGVSNRLNAEAMALSAAIANLEKLSLDDNSQ